MCAARTIPRTRTISFEPGKVVAQRFQIIDRLGEGVWGVVFYANDTYRRRRVALKFLKQEPHGEDLECLHREVDIGQWIRHPNVCQLYDLGKTEDGITFVSMEYVAGKNMEQELHRFRRLTKEKLIEYAFELCAGLEAIHAARLDPTQPMGVVHRDLKPANVMLDNDGHAKITDFGLAVPANLRVETRGTPLYMAPEQWRQQRPLPSADIYSLGLILFELFTGKTCIELPPNWHDFPPPLGEILRAHATARARRPSGETQDFTPAIDYIISRCLAEDPKSRPTAAELRALLTDL